MLSRLEFTPGRGLEGCPVTLRFHVEPVKGATARGAHTWTLMAGSAGGNPRDTARPVGTGVLRPSPSGDAAIPITFPYPGTYRYHLQVQDEAGRSSNMLSASIVIDRRSRAIARSCP